ncbi:hypothetical protein MTO96_042958 [Rhipicephalus appendiculatus]
MSTTAATKRMKKLKAALPIDPTSSGPRGLPRYAKASLQGLLTLLKMPPTAAGDERRCDLARNATEEIQPTSATTIGDNYEAQSRTPSSQTFVAGKQDFPVLLPSKTGKQARPQLSAIKAAS